MEITEKKPNVVLVIAEKIDALPILERCVQENFERNVRRECDLWIAENGLPEGKARQEFHTNMLHIIGEAFTVNGYCD